MVVLQFMNNYLVTMNWPKFMTNVSFSVGLYWSLIMARIQEPKGTFLVYSQQNFLKIATHIESMETVKSRLHYGMMELLFKKKIINPTGYAQTLK